MSYVVYGKDSCPMCDMAVMRLKMVGVDYQLKKFGVDYDMDELTTVAGHPVRAMPFIIEVDGSESKVIGDLTALTKHLMSR